MSVGDIMIYCRMINDEIHIESIVYGGDDSFMDSEHHTYFSKDDTAKILSMMSFEEFDNLCKEELSHGLNEFIKKHELNPRCITI